MSHPRRLNKDGFSLIELMVSIAISGIALAAITTTFVSQSQSYDIQEQLVEMQQNARAAMDIMTREIRMAGYSPTGASFDGVTYDASQIRVVADLNGDGDTGDQDEDITYSWDNTNLRIDRNANGTTEALAENMQWFNFDYLDSNGNTTINTANIRQIQITITARSAEIDRSYPANGGYRTYTMTSLITPRNLAY